MSPPKKPITINKSKSAIMQGYRIGLKQKPVSGTIKSTYSSFDDTTNVMSHDDNNNYTVSKIPSDEKGSNRPKINWTIVGILITVVLAIVGAAYKYGVLERSVEVIQGNISDLQKRIEKHEDNYKKDYNILDEKLNAYISKNKK
jgi:hypothetical protein